jgi:uncharacterized repeat protein (TIGR01451 family)
LLNAVAFAALTATPAACGGQTTALNFDGVSYNRAPRVLALPNITSRGDGNDTLGGMGSYTITVSNVGSQTLGGLGHLFRFVDQLPNNLTLASFSGAGWSCSGTGTRNVFCSNSASLAAGASLTPLVLNVNIGAGTPGNITNSPRVDVLEDGNLANNTTSINTTVVCPAITVNPAPPLPNGFVGTDYNQSFMQVGGVGAITWSVSAGALPGGLSLNPTTGALTGTPTTAGTATFTVRATDANGCFGERSYTVVISGDGLQFYPLPFPVRLLDTRAGFTGCDAPGFAGCSTTNAPLQGGSIRTQAARGLCDGVTIAANALGMVGNATVVNAQGGFLTFWPSSAAQPTIATSNYATGQVWNRHFTVGLGAADGAFKSFRRGRRIWWWMCRAISPHRQKPKTQAA